MNCGLHVFSIFSAKLGYPNQTIFLWPDVLRIFFTNILYCPQGRRSRGRGCPPLPSTRGGRALLPSGRKKKKKKKKKKKEKKEEKKRKKQNKKKGSISIVGTQKLVEKMPLKLHKFKYPPQPEANTKSYQKCPLRD